MKKLILSLVAIATISLCSFGQAPEGFKYQAVVRDAGNVILNNQAVGMRMTIQQGAIGGTTVYSETFSTTTNAYGLVNLEIGNGTLSAGNFTSIDWANGPFFMETAVDVTGGTNYSVMGTSQLMSVPYALYAKTSGSSTPGPQGPQGIQGPAGNDGAQGIAGAAGANGNGILSTTDNGDGTFTLNYTDGSSFTTSNLTGPTGLTGPAGSQGLQGAAGADGAQGPQGIQGLAGADGQGGVTTAGSGINVTGAGTIVSPYVVSTTSPCGLAIGQTYQGGIIFYLDASGCHGLISAPTDQSTGIQWWNGAFTDTYASGSGLFDGDGNCYRIRRSQGDCASCNAAELCLDLSLGGYSDWYLPSKHELNLMYLNIGQGNVLGLGNVGGFANYFYWSSTEVDLNYACNWSFDIGNPFTYYKGSSDYVRAIRAF
jgi:hypothetical protein